MSDDPAVPADPSVRRHRLFSPTEHLPRHSEGDLIRLDDEALLLVWTRFTAGDGGDHDPASLVASRFDDSTGRWSPDRVAVESSDGMNVMSVSLRRLPDGRLALFHLHKRSLVDCRPVVRFSSDEARTWSDPVEIVASDDVGYDVLNNDRVLQRPDGMMLLAIARHAGNGVGDRFRAAGRLRCHRSSDGGRTWHAGEWAPEVPGVVLQEPGLFEGADGTLRLFARTDAGVQYCADSKDDGRTWSVPRPWTLPSPLSPASIERLPDGDLLAIWNDPGPARLAPERSVLERERRD